MTAIEALVRRYREVDALHSASSLMGWDFQVVAPPGAAAARTAHTTILARMRHAALTSTEMRRDLDRAEAEVEPGSEDAALVRRLRRDVEQAVALPAALVERRSRVSGDAYTVWRKAKPANDFAALAPYLKELFEIAKETSESLGPRDHIYDNLIDLFEEGSTYQTARTLFDELEPFTVDLVERIRESDHPIDDSPLHGAWDPEALRRFAEVALAEMGFDFSRGRLNVANNAFCTTISNDDVRMTTRPSDHIKGVVSSSIHEMGHALYEQNSPAKWARTPLQGGVSLAVHESQSRTWENVVGRSAGFWRRFTPVLHRFVPALSSVDAAAMHRMMNRVEPTFIRVGADELTYNLHILIRFELEVALLTDKIMVNDLPEAWNDLYERKLGIRPSTATLGCLQDVHWTRGSVGYFPTYTFGNMMGLQIWDRLVADLGDVESHMESGDFRPILDWLIEKVYAKARLMTPAELLRSVVGQGMSAQPWISYARRKYSDLYQLTD